jgi:hypothetical protein
VCAQAHYVVRDAFHNVKEVNPTHHPHLWNNCTQQELDQGACTLNFTTVTQLIYDT